MMDPAFTVEVPAQAAVYCNVYNKKVPEKSAELTVDKQWVIDDLTVAHDSRPDGFEADLELSGPGDADPSPQDWAQARTGYSIGDDAAGAEGVEVPALCELVGVQSAREGADSEEADPEALDFPVYAEHSGYTVTNVVECRPQPSPDPSPSPSPSASPTPAPGDGSDWTAGPWRSSRTRPMPRPTGR
jgi:hypothetical protein